MCRLYAAEGNRSEEKTQLTLDILLNREEMELLRERAQHHREWEKKHNFIPTTYTERDELRYAIVKYLDELKEEKKTNRRNGREQPGC